MTYSFKIDDDYLIETSHFDAVSGNKNVYLCEFEINCTQSGAVWFAVFKKGENAYVTPILNRKCTVPYEILEKEGTAYIGCYAECDGEKRISTNWLPIKVESGAYSEGTAPEPPEPSLWETLLGNSVPVINENGNWFTYDMTSGEYADTGFTARGERGERGEKGDTGAAGYTPQKGIDYFTEADLAEFSQPLDTAKRISMYGADIEPSADSNFTFTSINNGAEYSVSKANDNISGDIVIPYEHEGKPVTSIAYTAFYQCANITSIVVPKSVVNIGGSAFQDMQKLSAVTIPDGEINIGTGIITVSPNAVIYCKRGSRAESYCKTNSLKHICTEDASKAELIEKIIVGYSALAAEPDNWNTNWTDYYINTGTAREPIYTAVSTETAPSFASGQYFEYSDAPVSAINRGYEPDSKQYNFCEVAVCATFAALASGNSSFSVWLGKTQADTPSTKLIKVEAANVITATANRYFSFSAARGAIWSGIYTNNGVTASEVNRYSILSNCHFMKIRGTIPAGTVIEVYGKRGIQW